MMDKEMHCHLQTPYTSSSSASHSRIRERSRQRLHGLHWWASMSKPMRSLELNLYLRSCMRRSSMLRWLEKGSKLMGMPLVCRKRQRVAEVPTRMRCLCLLRPLQPLPSQQAAASTCPPDAMSHVMQQLHTLMQTMNALGQDMRDLRREQDDVKNAVASLAQENSWNMKDDEEDQGGDDLGDISDSY